MTIRLEEIVYLHCHQQGKAGARVLEAIGTLALALLSLGSVCMGMLQLRSRAGVQRSGWSLLCKCSRRTFKPAP